MAVVLTENEITRLSVEARLVLSVLLRNLGEFFCAGTIALIVGIL
jgi:hypothetical protein